MAGVEMEDLISNRTPGRGTKDPGQVLPIPVNPIVYAALRALYAGGAKNHWLSDLYGRPHYHYHARDGKITIYYELPVIGYLPWNQPTKGLPTFHRHFHGPRWGFIYAGRLRDAVRNMSVETADVFLILMACIAKLPDPRRDTARIRLEEIAEYRGVKVRHGSSQRLYGDLKQEALRLADLRLNVTWMDYKTGRTMVFGRERPDRLFDLVDLEYRRGDSELAAFSIRCGQALAQFLNPEGLRWIGHYSRALLHLSPYHDALAKKMGTYWIMIGVTAGKKGLLPQASPRTILDFCGEDINWRYPGQTVDSFIQAHNKLQELGVLEEVSVLEPPNRKKGYFAKWLDNPLVVRLSKNLWKISLVENRSRAACSHRVNRTNRAGQPERPPNNVPRSSQQMQDDPGIIKQFRDAFGMHQVELARALGVTRQTLSKYERGLSPLPGAKAERICQIWRGKLKKPKKQD